MPAFNDAALIVAFWEDADQMGLSTRTKDALANEGIASPSDLADFDHEGLKAVWDNFKKPPKIMVYADAQAAAAGNGQLQDQEPFFISAKSKKRIATALDAVKYYALIGRPLDTDMMHWDTLTNFEVQWKALKERKDADSKDTPKLVKGMSPHKYIESVNNYLRSEFGVREVPLLYVARASGAAVAMPAPPLEVNQPHSAEHGSVEEELIARTSHAGPLFRIDSGMVYDVYEEGLRGTAYAATIVPFRRTRDGFGAARAFLSQHAGTDVWDTNAKLAHEFLTTRKWNGLSNITLSKHMTKHRSSYITLTEAAEHVPVEVPGERARVGYLIDSITSKDPEVLAGVAAVRTDEAGKRVHFEDTVTYMLPLCPVAKKQAARRQSTPQANISGTTGKGGSDLKAGIGKTGVELRYHKHHEFRKLTSAQKSELAKWNAENKKRLATEGGTTKTAKKKMKAMISSAMAEQKPVLQALADSQKAITAHLSSLTAPAAPAAPAPQAQVGSTNGQVMVQEAEQADEDELARLHKLADIAAIKLQGILKQPKKKQG